MVEEKIEIDNLKCGGCASTIHSKLSSLAGVSEVSVDLASQAVKITMTTPEVRTAVLSSLASLGYPGKGTSHGLKKLGQDAISYVSCAIGKIRDN